MNSMILLLPIYILLQCNSPLQAQPWRKQLGSVAWTVGINPLNPSTIYAEGSTGTLQASFNKGSTWAILGTPPLSLIRQILVHPADTMTIFCADGGSGLQKSTDYGSTWRTVLSGFGIDGESIIIDPTHPDTMFAGNFINGNVFRSLDRGETWTQQGDAGQSLCAFNIRPDSLNILYAGVGLGRIGKSTDYGVTWRIVKDATPGVSFEEVPKIEISRSNPFVAYATTIGDEPSPALGIWKTTDGGEHWMQTALPSISTWGMVIDQRDDKILYTGTFTSAAANVFQTTNGGASWTSLGFNLPNNGDVWSIKKHPLDTNGIWAAVSHGVSGGIYRFSYPIASVQGSVRDSLTNDIVLLGRVKVISSADSVFLGDTNGEFTFQFYDTDPLPFVARVDAYPYYSKEVELDIIIGSVSTQDILLQRLPLTSFEGTVVDSSTHLPVQAEVTLTAHAVFGPANLSQSTDMSGHFEFTNVALPGSPYVSNYSLFIDPELPFGQLSIASLHIDTSNAPIQLSVNRADVFVVGEDSLDFQNYYRTALDTLRIKSNIWNTITKGPAPLSRGAEFSKKSVIYFTGNKHTPISQESLDTLVACLNAGCNLFLTGQDIAENSDTSILFHDYIGLKFSENSSVIYCSGSPGDLFDGMGFYTTVDGANDQTSRDVLRALSPAAIPVMEYGGIGTGKPSVVRIDSVGTGGKAIVMGFGFEAISVPMNRQKVMERIIKYFDGTAGVVEQHDQQLANHFSLAQNYPNPFNSSTIIRYRLPTSAYVSIRVYDVLGREVRVLVEELEDAGLKSIRFDSAGLSSGIYFYRMQSRKFTQTLKLLVLQ